MMKKDQFVMKISSKARFEETENLPEELILRMKIEIVDIRNSAFAVNLSLRYSRLAEHLIECSLVMTVNQLIYSVP